jgi:hypothetical protein
MWMIFLNGAAEVSWADAGSSTGLLRFVKISHQVIRKIDIGKCIWQKAFAFHDR